MDEFIKMAVASVVVLILGPLVKPILDAATRRIDLSAPKGIEQATWNHIAKEMRVGSWIGFFERFLALASFWIPAYSIIAAWFAFKLAAKWESWKNIAQFPKELNKVKVDELDFFRARSAVSSYFLTRFLIGTIANVLIGLVAWYIGTTSLEICPCLKP